MGLFLFRGPRYESYRYAKAIKYVELAVACSTQSCPLQIEDEIVAKTIIVKKKNVVWGPLTFIL